MQNLSLIFIVSLIVTACGVATSAIQEAEKFDKNEKLQISTRIFVDLYSKKQYSDEQIEFGFELACLNANGERQVLINTDSGIDAYDVVKANGGSKYIENGTQNIPDSCIVDKKISLRLSAWDNNNFSDTFLIKDKASDYTIIDNPTHRSEQPTENAIWFIPRDFKGEMNTLITLGLNCTHNCIEIPEEMRPHTTE